MKSKTLNMTQGSPTKLLIIFAIPMLIGNVFQQMYNLVDSVIVGKYVGANALAAVGATNHVSFLFFSLCNGIGSGGGIITAQQFGAGNKENVKKGPGLFLRKNRPGPFFFFLDYFNIKH